MMVEDSTIWYKENGIYRGTYCCKKGEIASQGILLYVFYGHKKKAKKLANLYVLDRLDGTCAYYTEYDKADEKIAQLNKEKHKYRGRGGTVYKEQISANIVKAKYNYVYTDGKWYVVQQGGGLELDRAIKHILSVNGKQIINNILPRLSSKNDVTKLLCKLYPLMSDEVKDYYLETLADFIIYDKTGYLWKVMNTATKEIITVAPENLNSYIKQGRVVQKWGDSFKPFTN